MTFQSSCKHGIAASFAFKQKAFTATKCTANFKVPSTDRDTAITSHLLPLLYSLIRPTAFSQFLGSNGTELGLHFIFLPILRVSGVGMVEIF